MYDNNLAISIGTLVEKGLNVNTYCGEPLSLYNNEWVGPINIGTLVAKGLNFVPHPQFDEIPSSHKVLCLSVLLAKSGF